MEDKAPEGIDNGPFPALESDRGPFDIFGQKGYHINRKDTLGGKEMRFSRNQ